MASVRGKRKAADPPEGSAKRLRIDRLSNEFTAKPASNGYSHNETENYEVGDHGESASSDDGSDADTPITPFSPGRKKFPSELKTIECTYEGCPKTFNRPARLTAHLRSHTNERPYVCPYDDCDKAYLQDKHLQHHIKGSHTKERAYSCDEEGCDKSFVTSTRLKRHKEAHRGRDRFRCTEYPPCNVTFRKHQTLQRHIRSDHMDLMPFPCTYIHPSTNEPCTAGFDGSTGLSQHMERVHGNPRARVFCTQCTIPDVFTSDRSPIYYSFTSEAKLQAHIRKEHAQCLFCDTRFSSHAQLQEHIETQHSGKSVEERKTHLCTFLGCGKKFTKANNLRAHTRTAHLGERYICGNFDLDSHPDLPGYSDKLGCGHELSSKQSVVDHIRTAHLGLPTSIKRKKSEATRFVDDEDEEIRGRRKRSSKATVIDHLLGTSQTADPARKIKCPIAECPHMFLRDYDLEIHLQSAMHRTSTRPSPDAASVMTDLNQEVEIAARDTPYVTIPAPPLNLDPNLDPALFTAPFAPEITMRGQQDIDWELQQRALHGGAFWVGAEDAGGGEEVDEWAKEQEEMRRLIEGGN